MLLEGLLDDLGVGDLFAVEFDEGEEAVLRPALQGVLVLVVDLVEAKEGLNLQAVRGHVGEGRIPGELVQVHHILAVVLLVDLSRLCHPPIEKHPPLAPCGSISYSRTSCRGRRRRWPRWPGNRNSNTWLPSPWLTSFLYTRLFLNRADKARANRRVLPWSSHKLPFQKAESVMIAGLIGKFKASVLNYVYQGVRVTEFVETLRVFE